MMEHGGFMVLVGEKTKMEPRWCEACENDEEESEMGRIWRAEEGKE